MIIEQEKYNLNGKELILRCAEEADAEILLEYIKVVSGETRFLMCDSDEIRFTLEQEKAFINSHNESEKKLLILAFVDGEYAGNCSLMGKASSRRNAHRAGIGIALYQKYTGQGIGKIMLEKLISEAKKAGFEQCELTVIEGNERAYKLYDKLGFRECGRIPRANKYSDGTYADDIHMVLELRAYKLVIFDMDGTILNTLEDIADSVNYALSTLGYPKRTLSEIKSFVGNGRIKLLERAVPQGLSELEFEAVVEKQTEYYSENSANHTKPFDGILELMKALREKGIHVAVHTNKAEEDAKNLLDKYFEGQVEYCVGDRGTLAKKPAADGVVELMNHFNVDRRETVYIGDSEVDIDTTVNADINGIIVDWGYRETQYLQSYVNKKGDYAKRLQVVSSMEELRNGLLATELG